MVHYIPYYTVAKPSILPYYFLQTFATDQISGYPHYCLAKSPQREIIKLQHKTVYVAMMWIYRTQISQIEIFEQTQEKTNKYFLAILQAFHLSSRILKEEEKLN